MPKESNIELLPIIKDVFDSVFRDYGFKLQNEAIWDGQGENVITASKGDIALNFYLGTSQLFYYCSAGIELSGNIGEKATSHLKYRNLGVSAIAKALDPNFKRPPKGAQTKKEVIELFEIEKDNLLKYCKDILLGDVSSWSRIADQMVAASEKAKNKGQESTNKPNGIMAGLNTLFGKK